jgi:hypothetical protein
MRSRFLTAALALLAGTGLVRAGNLEDALESRWRGAWVLTSVDIYSDCAGIHTDNGVSGSLVRSRGRFRFKSGELARVQNIDLKHSEIDFSLSLPEPLLLSQQDGPFTLYNEARCLVDLDVELPRSLVKEKDLKGIEAALEPILTRFATQEAATGSKSWNRRQRDPYPDGYDRTLAAHAAWKAQQANAGIQARIDRAAEETSRITDRIGSDPEYLKGFAAGVEAVRALDLAECNDILSRDFDKLVPAPTALAGFVNEAAGRYQRGYQDGARLLFGLESMRKLPGCMVQVPEAPEGAPPAPPRSR